MNQCTKCGEWIEDWTRQDGWIVCPACADVPADELPKRCPPHRYQFKHEFVRWNGKNDYLVTVYECEDCGNQKQRLLDNNGRKDKSGTANEHND